MAAIDIIEIFELLDERKRFEFLKESVARLTTQQQAEIILGYCKSDLDKYIDCERMNQEILLN